MNLFKTSVWMGFSSILRIVTNLVTIKILAIYVGPSGVALLGNFTNFTAMLGSFSNLATSTGVTKLIAEYDDEKSKLSVLASSIKLTLFVSIILGVIITLFSETLASTILLSALYKPVFVTFGVCIIFYGMNTTLTSIIVGYRNTQAVIISGIVASVLNMLLSILITVNFGLFGALINSVGLQVIIFIPNLLFFIYVTKVPCDVHKIKVNMLQIKRLSSYSLMSAASLVCVPVGLMIIRGSIVKATSAMEAGYVQSVWNISNIYISIVITILTTYFLPRISSLKEQPALVDEVKLTTRIILSLTCVGLILVYLTQDLVIQLFFTSEFIAMKKYLTYHIVGDFFKIFSLIFEYVLVSKAFVRWNILFTVLSTILYVVLSILLINRFGPIGESISYCITSFVFLVILQRFYTLKIK